MADTILEQQYPSIFGKTPNQQIEENYPSAFPSQSQLPIDGPEEPIPLPIARPSDYPQSSPNINERAPKASMGVTDKTGITEDQIKKDMSDGNESNTRALAAAQIDANRFQSALGQYTINSNPEAARELLKPNDPDTVFERHYAQEYVDRINWPKKPDQFANDVPLYYHMIGVPEQWDYLTKNMGQPISAIKEVARTIRDYAKPATGADIAADLIFDFASAGLYGEYRMRQAGVFEPGILLGSNIDGQALRFYTLAATDFDAAKKEMQDTYSRIAKTDPVMAYRWISAIAGQGENERFTSNVFTLLNAGGAVASLPKGARTAVWDMVRSSPRTVRPEVSAAAASGNIAEAAVRQNVHNVASEIRGDANYEDMLRQRLGTQYDIDKSKVASDPANLSREQSNRIQDMIDADKQNFVDGVMSAQRVQKTPAATQIEAQTRRIQSELADRNRGIDNQVLNVSDPEYIHGLNVFKYDVHIGTHDGDVFRSLDELRANAERNGLIEKGSFINAKDIDNEKSLTNLVEAWRMQAVLARTPEGKATAEGGMELIRQKIRNLPRHETGYTIGERNPPTAATTIDEALTQVRPQGNGFYIIKSVFLKPDEDFVRDGLITTALNTVKDFRAAKAAGMPSTSIPLFNNWRSGWLNGILGRVRDPSERLSITENMNRLIATHGPGVLLGIGEKTGKPIRAVPRQDWEPFNRMLKANQKAFNEGEHVPGVWFDYPSQVKEWFVNQEKRLPHDNTVDAYFAYKNMNLHDLNLRDLLVGQRKLERGFTLNNVRYTDIEGNAAQTGFFEGVRMYELPEDWRYLMVTGNNRDSTKVMRSRFYKPDYKAVIQEDVKRGAAKLIQIADPKSRPMRDLDGRRIEYVLAYGNRHQEKPIAPLGHVNRLGGGHLLPEWDWYLKQAHVDDGVYEGDKTILNFMTRAQAKEALPHLENVRQAFQKYKASLTDQEAIDRLVNEGGMDAKTDLFEEAVNANKVTGIPFDKHYNWYFGKNRFLDLNEPIHVVPKDTKIIDTPQISKSLYDRHRRADEHGNPIELVDGTRGQGSLLGKTLTEFTGERDAEGIWTLANRGTQQNPLFAYEPAPYVDPLVAAERAYGRISKTMFLGDMQDYSREHWLQQAIEADALQATPQEIRDNPFQHFFNPQYKDGFKKQTELYWQLEANRKQAMDFTGIPNDIQKGIRGIGQSLADSIYTNVGANKWTVSLMRDLPRLKSPTGVIRNWTFNPVLGLFSLPSMFTQISTFGNVLALSPRQAPGAAIATLLYGISKLNRQPGMMEHLDSLATQMRLPGTTGWKPGEWTEFVNLLESSGFHRSGENAFLSNLGDKVIKRGGMTVLDWGRLPFNLGSGFTKIGGYATAYLEHRLQNPFGPVTEQNKATILSRAGLLDHNMSSAFNTQLQTGAWGVALQFQAYDFKLMSMMTGKNLTPAEKGRMFLTSSLLYGVGVGGIGAVGFPIANWINNQVQTNFAGVNPGQSPISDVIFSGVPATIGKYLTGLGDYTQGTLYNFGRWGNKGIDWIEQLLSHDSTMRGILSGVSGNVFGNTLSNTYGLRQYIKSVATDGGQRDITWDDVLNNFNEVSTVRNTRRFLDALSTGHWMSQNGAYVQDITKTEAVMQYIFGLSPTEGSQIFQKEEMVREYKENVAWHERYITKQLGLAVKALDNNDPDTYKKYMRVIQTELDSYIPFEQQDAAVHRAQEGLSKSQVDRLNFELLYKQMQRPEQYIQSVK